MSRWCLTLISQTQQNIYYIHVVLVVFTFMYIRTVTTLYTLCALRGMNRFFRRDHGVTLHTMREVPWPTPFRCRLTCTLQHTNNNTNNRRTVYSTVPCVLICYVLCTRNARICWEYVILVSLVHALRLCVRRKYALRKTKDFTSTSHRAFYSKSVI